MPIRKVNDHKTPEIVEPHNTKTMALMILKRSNRIMRMKGGHQYAMTEAIPLPEVNPIQKTLFSIVASSEEYLCLPLTAYEKTNLPNALSPPT